MSYVVDTVLIASMVIGFFKIKKGAKTMSGIVSDFLAKQVEFNNRQSASIDSLVKSFEGVSADVTEQKRMILELQNSSGTVTAEDQALIDQLETNGNALAEKMEAVALALKTLDEQTPPAPPPDVP